jgi:hypothetical protein
MAEMEKTTAFHGMTEDAHVVGVGNLRVVIIPDGDGWFAQGLAARGRNSDFSDSSKICV